MTLFRITLATRRMIHGFESDGEIGSAVALVGLYGLWAGASYVSARLLCTAIQYSHPTGCHGPG